MSFCSREDLAARGPPAAGTGVRADAYVFLPVPKRLWGEREMNTGWASNAELSAISAARRGGVVTRLYNPPKAADSAPILVLHGPNRPTAAGLGPLLDALAGRWPVETDPGPRLAICTHGTRDRCCAKFGFAAYTAARALFEAGASPFEPLECSHLGGDRFAATGIFFPTGSMYAHLDSQDLKALTELEASGRFDPAHYRGRVFEGPVFQLVRAGLARDGVLDSADGRLNLRRDPPDGLQVTAALADGRRFDVTLGHEPVRFYASCDKLAATQAAVGTRLVYRGATPLDAGIAAAGAAIPQNLSPQRE